MNDCPCSYTACVAFVLPTSPSLMPYVEARSAGVVLCVCVGGGTKERRSERASE